GRLYPHQGKLPCLARGAAADGSARAARPRTADPARPGESTCRQRDGDAQDYARFLAPTWGDRRGGALRRRWNWWRWFRRRRARLPGPTAHAATCPTSDSAREKRGCRQESKSGREHRETTAPRIYHPVPLERAAPAAVGRSEERLIPWSGLAPVFRRRTEPRER